jgi:tetratricopeptide (TPR) repeat protein
MKTRLVIAFIALQCLYMVAQAQQQPNLIALKKQLRNSRLGADKVALANKIAAYYRTVSSDSTLYYTDIAITYSKNMPVVLQLDLLAKGIVAAEKKGNYQKGILYGLRGLEFAEGQRDIEQMSKFYGYLGGIYFRLENNQKALEYLEKEGPLLDKLGDREKQSVWANLMGHIYLKKGEPKKALNYYNQSKKLMGDEYILCSIWGDIGRAYADMNNCTEALKYHKKNMVCYESRTKDANKHSQILIGMSDAYLCMGDIERAIQTSELGLKISREFGSWPHQKEHLENLSQAYAAQAHHNRAYYYHQLYAEVKDSILNVDGARQIATYELEYQNEKKERELEKARHEIAIQKLEQVNERKNWLLIVGAILFGLLTVIIIFQWRAYRARQQNLDLEQKLLRSQMNPHFIFNALMAIKKFMYKQDIASMDRFLFRIAHVIRHTLESTRFESIRLDREIELWRHYLELQQLRMPHRFNFDIDIDPVLSLEQIEVPPMLVQPLLENAVEHGIGSLPENEEGQIEVIIKKIETGLKVVIRDNGLGLKTDKERVTDPHLSMGTNIIKDRLAFINKSTKGKVQLSYKDLKNDAENQHGTEVSLFLPLESKPKVEAA